MGTASKIEWTQHTASPWHGCTEVHAGCDHCYAREMAKRNPATLGVWGDAGTRVLSKSFHANCRRWNAQAEKAGVRASVFPSICDPFEDFTGRMFETIDTMDDARRDLFATIDASPWLDFLLLTKRPQNVRRMWVQPINAHSYGSREQLERLGRLQHYDYQRYHELDKAGWRHNVWLLTSISDQPTADAMVPELLKCRDLVPVLGVSAEPLLGPIDLAAIGRNATGWPAINALTGERRAEQGPTTRVHDGPKIDWIIIGGESGHNARPCRATWVRDIVRQCQDAAVPVFVKQLGANAEEGYGVNRKLRLTDGKGGDPLEWPEDIRVRQFPDT